MATSAVARPARKSPRKRKQPAPLSHRMQETLKLAEHQGLLSGTRTLTIRGRMPSQLVEQAKQNSGIDSDSKLLEAALASLAVGDSYMEWLISRSGTVDPSLDLEY